MHAPSALKKLGWAALLFFTLKGLAWLALVGAGALALIDSSR